MLHCSIVCSLTGDLASQRGRPAFVGNSEKSPANIKVGFWVSDVEWSYNIDIRRNNTSVLISQNLEMWAGLLARCIGGYKTGLSQFHFDQIHSTELTPSSFIYHRN